MKDRFIKVENLQNQKTQKEQDNSGGKRGSNTSKHESLEDNLKYNLKIERELIKYKVKTREQEEKINYLLKEIDILERKIECIEELENNDEKIKIECEKRHNKKEAVAVALASDWHVEEKVEKSVVNNLNEYNPDIASLRIKYFFKNLLRLIRKEQYTSIINNLVLWLGGDLMSGYIHEELIESNYMSPTETLLFLKKHLISGIEFLCKESNLKIYIPTNYGNHGRTGEKLKVSTGYKNSYEYLLYKILEDYFLEKREKRVIMQIEKGEFNFIQVFDKTIRSSHGYHIKYNGGIGGITIPAMKFIATQNRIKHADYDIWGHHHQYFTNPFFCQNGSLIGISAYGRRIGGEEPKQAFFIIDKKRGITTQMPIFTN